MEIGKKIVKSLVNPNLIATLNMLWVCDPIWYVCYFAFICHSAPRYDFWKEQNLLVYKEKDAAQLGEQFQNYKFLLFQ